MRRGDTGHQPGRARVRAAILMWWRTYKESPTRAELGRHLGISREVAGRLVAKLAEDGAFIVEGKGRHRNIIPAFMAVGQASKAAQKTA